jgi:hypothetical protein
MADLGADELTRRQAAFLADCGASPAEAAASKSYDVAELRQSHVKAYAPWTEDEERDLRRRHQAGETVGAIAAQLGRKPGAIRSRLKKLALI